jgi:hypothetical protein
MAIITENPEGQIFDKQGSIQKWWAGWFRAVFICCFSIQDAGPDASRPTTDLWIGRRYFSTTLGYPIWLRSTGPNVWVDATGTPR